MLPAVDLAPLLALFPLCLSDATRVHNVHCPLPSSAPCSPSKFPSRTVPRSFFPPSAYGSRFFQCISCFASSRPSFLFFIAPLRTTFRALISLGVFFSSGHAFLSSTPYIVPRSKRFSFSAAFVYLGRCASRPPPFILSASLFVYSFAPFALVPRLLFPSSFRF